MGRFLIAGKYLVLVWLWGFPRVEGLDTRFDGTSALL
jgi:hypothetical protein